MAVRRYKDVTAFHASHVAPHLGVMGAPGVGKTELVGSLARPPLNYRTLMLTTELRTLPGGLAEAIYQAGGQVAEINRVADLVEIAKEVRGAGLYDAVVIDSYTDLNWEDIHGDDKVGEKADMGDYYTTEIAMTQTVRLLKAAGVPLLSTLREDWVPNRAHDPRQGEVPEQDRKYVLRLPRSLRKDWGSKYEALGRLTLSPPSGPGSADTRWLQFAPKEGRWETKTLWEWHLPGLVIPKGECAALFLLYPWLQETGRITVEQEEYAQRWASKVKR